MSESVEKLTAEQKLARLKTKADEAEAKVQNAKKRAAQLRARAEREEAKMRARADARDAAQYRSRETQVRLAFADAVLVEAQRDESLRTSLRRRLLDAIGDDGNERQDELLKDVLAGWGVQFGAPGEAA